MFDVNAGLINCTQNASMIQRLLLKFSSELTKLHTVASHIKLQIIPGQYQQIPGKRETFAIHLRVSLRVSVQAHLQETEGIGEHELRNCLLCILEVLVAKEHVSQTNCWLDG